MVSSLPRPRASQQLAPDHSRGFPRLIGSRTSRPTGTSAPRSEVLRLTATGRDSPRPRDRVHLSPPSCPCKTPREWRSGAIGSPVGRFRGTELIPARRFRGTELVPASWPRRVSFSGDGRVRTVDMMPKAARPRGLRGPIARRRRPGLEARPVSADRGRLGARSGRPAYPTHAHPERIHLAPPTRRRRGSTRRPGGRSDRARVQAVAVGEADLVVGGSDRIVVSRRVGIPGAMWGHQRGGDDGPGYGERHRGDAGPAR